MPTVPNSPPGDRERRRYRRYIVKGSVIINPALPEAAGDATVGELLNIGLGGVLLRSKTIPREGTRVSLRFSFDGYPEKTLAEGQVVGTKPDLMAVKFLEQPAGIDAVLNWLEQEHYPWTANA
jgi:hypothetical protein